jgi:hypothetical protein
MKHTLSESFSEGSVAAADKAYDNVLARHSLLDFSRQEVEGAKAALQSQGCDGIESRDIQFQASITRLKARKDLSPQTLEEVFHELLNAEYECDQAEWERDCHRRAFLSHSPRLSR